MLLYNSTESSCCCTYKDIKSQRKNEKNNCWERVSHWERERKVEKVRIAGGSIRCKERGVQKGERDMGGERTCEGERDIKSKAVGIH